MTVFIVITALYLWMLTGIYDKMKLRETTLTGLGVFATPRTGSITFLFFGLKNSFNTKN